MKKFIVAATQRSGTHFLESVLSSNPQIYCYSEVLANKYHDKEWNFYHFWLKKVKADESNITFKAMLSCFDEFLGFIFNRRTGIKAIGIDIKYNHFIYIPNIIWLLKKHDVHVLHLVRKNLLKTLISSMLNEQKVNLTRTSRNQTGSKS